MRITKLFFFVLMLCAFFPCKAHSFSLGKIKVKNSFGEKFYAEVIVDNIAKKGLKVFIGSPQDYALLGVRRSKIADKLRIIEPIEFVSSNQQLVRIVSDKPLFYPSFELIIKASLEGGTILEKYSLAVDFKKNMSIELSPPALKEKTLSRKPAETPKFTHDKKDIDALEVQEPAIPKVAAKRKAKKPIAVKKKKIPVKKKAAKKKPTKPKKTEIIAEDKKDRDKVKVTAKAPKTTEKKFDVNYKKTSSKNSLTYTVNSGDTLFRIINKVKPQKKDFVYRSLVALWNLNKNKFLHENINGLKVGTHLSFDNLDEEAGKISGREAAQILRDQWVEWKNIRAGIRMLAGKEEVVREIPLPGENIIAANNIPEILSGWRQSWEKEDMASHFSYYSDNFLSRNYLKKNVGLEDWKQYKSHLVEKNKNITVNIKNLHICKERDYITASFLQKFSSDNLISFGTKNMTFVKEGEQWKIKEELFRLQKTEILGSNFPFVVQTSTHKYWTLATKEANRLRKAGFAAYLVKSTGDSKGLRFRIVIGRFRTQIDAYHFAKKLIRGKYVKHTIVQKLPYAISLGSLKSEAEAYRIVQNYREKRYSPYVFSVGDEKEITHYVLVGGYKNKKSANEVSKKLSKKGVSHTVIRP